MDILWQQKESYRCFDHKNQHINDTCGRFGIYIPYKRKYTTLNDDNANAVSQVLGYAMAQSVACGLQNKDSQTFIPKPTLSETLESCQSILSDFKQSDLGISLVK